MLDLSARTFEQQGKELRNKLKTILENNYVSWDNGQCLVRTSGKCFDANDYCLGLCQKICYFFNDRRFFVWYKAVELDSEKRDFGWMMVGCKEFKND